MTLHDISTKTGISLVTLRKLEKLKINFANIEPPADDPAAPIRFHLMRNQILTIGQVLALIDAPNLIDDLGKYAGRARSQLAALGDMIEPAPSQVGAEIRQAGKGDDDAALVIAEWLKAVLPVRPVTHHWIAARLLLPLNEFMRAQAMPMLSLALLNVRRLPEFAGYWRSEKAGHRNVIKYSQPATKPLDL